MPVIVFKNEWRRNTNPAQSMLLIATNFANKTPTMYSYGMCKFANVLQFYNLHVHVHADKEAYM